MLAFFRNNQSTTAIALAIYVALLHLPAMLGWAPAHSQAGREESLLFTELFGWTLGKAQVSALLAAVLVYIQAILVNRLADTYRLLNERNWIPGALYALLASSLPDFLYLSSTLVAVTVVPIALSRLFSVYKQTSAFASIFDAAFWISAGCLFHSTIAWLLIASYMGFFNLRSFNAREQIIFWVGIVVPVFLAVTGFFWFGKAGLFLEQLFSPGLGLVFFPFSGKLMGDLKSVYAVLLILVALSGFSTYYFKKLIQVQKYITIFYWFLFGGLAATLLQHTMRFEHLLLIMPVAAIFLTYLFQARRNLFVAEVFHFVLLVTAFLFQFIAVNA